MPTADEFDAYARTFDATAERLIDAVRSVERRGVTGPVEAPTITIPLDARVTDMTGRCRSAAARCADLASECRHRAEVCRRYTAAHAAYEHAAAAWAWREREARPGDWVGERPQPPVRPAPWAERG